MNFDRLEHIAVMVKDLDKSTEALKKILGVEHVPTLEW